jgi:acyl-[acyl-carrier-protein]-phospholipid O-acyltransferase/long-chain-fatty-acid--[acyl-carrier-protein] ligase
MNQPREQDDSESGGGLFSASFQALLFTQLLTSTNDNLFRWLVIGIGKDHVDTGNVGLVLMAGTVCFVVPYLLLAAHAGYLADRFSKRSVIVGCKFAEIVIMGLGIVAIWSESLWAIFAVVALMGAQSALFSPSKLGIIPEMLPARSISAANALFGLTTVAATVVGMGVGNWLSDVTGYRGLESLWISAVVLIGMAIAGTMVSLAIRRFPSANPERNFPWNAASRTLRDLGTLASNRALLRVALGIVFFWSVGALAQLNIDQFADEGGALYETDKVPLLFSLVLGVGIGSVLAGVWSAGRVELGILPLGAFGIAVCSALLFTVQGTIIDPNEASSTTFFVACFFLFLLGCGAGLFSIPLEAYMQHRSPPKSRGSILAATNFLVFTGILISAAAFAALRTPFHEGSLANIPTDMIGDTLPGDAQQRLDQLAEGVAAQVSGTGETTIGEALAEFPESQQPAALAGLLWAELKAKKQADFATRWQTYADQFPAHKRLVKAVSAQAAGLPLLDSRQIFLLAGIGTVPVFIYIVCLIPQATIRFLVWLASRTVYRVRVFGDEHLPAEGGAVLVPNHVSWIDGILLLLTSSRPIRMIVWAGNFETPFLRWLANLWGVILIKPQPKAIVKALATARKAIESGDLVCIFPEGGITRSGILQPFKPGLMKILKGTDAPVIPVYLDGLWGSIFSFEGGKFFWKRPKRWPYPISIFFGKPLVHPEDIHQVRRSVEQLGARAVQQRASEQAQMVPSFIRRSKAQRFRQKVADSTGAEMTGGALLMRSLILRRLLRQHVLDEGEQFVGLLLPPSAGGIAANVALSLDRRVAVNLNYTVSSEALNACIELAGIHHVLTSRRFMEKFDFELDAEIVFLEDLREKLTLADKIVPAIQTYAVPAGTLIKSLGLDKIKSDDVLTVIFTSGSTGVPKGVMLTHANVASQAEAIKQVIRLRPTDVVLGLLPFFHSFGYTITLWTVLTIEAKGAYHFNPLDAKQVGKLCQKYQGTILVATPTFLRGYLRRCDKEQFASLDVVVAGAEKLSTQLCDKFEEKFDVRPVEGYGATELSPLVSVNIPPSRSSGSQEVDLKEGTVGRPIPGVSAKVVDLDTGEELGPNQAGMLLITGSNVMKGYLGREDLTSQAVKDGWYVTGDVGMVDEDGFITITGRESRFSKIGGEMVPHIQVEETLAQLLGNEEDLQAAVTAIPDAKKGERLIVIHTKIDKTPSELRQGLAEAGLPNIFIPAPDSYHEVAELPLLGTGKLDLKRIRQIAEEEFGTAE